MDPLTDPVEVERRLHFAAQIAEEAGRRALGLRQSGRWKDEGVLGDVGDQAADGYLQGYLRGRYPLDGILSEETKDSAERQGKRLVWIVDPLDGTKEYRTGREDWAVHVGLCLDGKPALGAVALPSLGRVLFGVCLPRRTEVHMRSSEGQEPLAASAARRPGAPLRLVVSRSHTPDWIQAFGRAMGGAELLPTGSVGFKLSRLLLGEADIYVHKQGLKEWDTCAPEIVARAAGWSVCRIDGTEQRYNQVDPRNDEIVVCRPELREAVLAALAGTAPAAG